MIKINKKDIESGLKMIGGIMAMVALGIIAKSLDIPIEFSIGGKTKNNTFQSSVSTAQKSIESIMKSVEYAKYPSEITSAADSIYNIAEENQYDEDVTSYAVAALGQLTSKANYPSGREHIVELIKDIANF